MYPTVTKQLPRIELVKCVLALEILSHLSNRPIELFENGHRDVAFRTPGVDQGLQWKAGDKNISYGMRETTGCR